MKFNNSIVLAALCTLVASCPVDTSKRDVNPALVPSLGFKSGVNPTGTGDCDGAVKDASGKPIKVPCACPPDQASFNKALSANVAAGHAINNPSVGVSFPTDGSVNSQITRVQAALVTLQNLNGPGKGCPAVSTTLSAQLSALQNGGAKPAAAPKRDVDPALVPPLGFTAGVNPTGTGDCDGAVKGADGKPIKIPCSCPPSQASFNQALSANVAAGHAVNNPSVAVSFPTDGSVNSQITRVQAALVTLQNLNGPGKGCPAVSTTLSAQLSALQNGGAPPAPATPPPAPAPAAPAPAPAPAPPAQGTPPPADAASLSTAQLDSLTPQFGFASNVNPTGV
ncbi:hypothetical protein BD410DRAFT_726815 [Rickenella mellea]|uniref:Uncharacterized protein n=1 Tax=Rickenella mellea TaxID=50990 RepID=A0A4Y7PXI5_9AGAM|nr:hypothetical protein BD410DRAFT_726815 [Rickenella mellea]